MNPFDRPIPADFEMFTVEVQSYSLVVVAVAAKSPEDAERMVREGRGVALALVHKTTEYEVIDGQGNCRLKGERNEEE